MTVEREMPPQSCLTSSTVYLARLRSSVGLASTCFDTFSSILLSRANITSLFQLLPIHNSFMIFDSNVSATDLAQSELAKSGMASVLRIRALFECMDSHASPRCKEGLGW